MKWPGRRAQRDESAEVIAAAEEQRARAHRTGEILRQARAARGQSVIDVEQDTRINRLYIEALEAARFEVLPAPIYARGFMRSYARYLGLDPEEAARAVPRDLPRPAGLEPWPGLRRAVPVTLPAINAPIVIAIVVAVVLVVGAVLIVPRLGGGSGIEAPISVTPAASATGATGARGAAPARPVPHAGTPLTFRPLGDGPAPAALPAAPLVVPLPAPVASAARPLDVVPTHVVDTAAERSTVGRPLPASRAPLLCRQPLCSVHLDWIS